LKLFRRNRKAISTVIATIIIVAIAIVMAISAAYWAMGVGGAFTRFEKMQYTYAYVTPVTGDADANYKITFELKNTGQTTTTLSDQVLINGQPATATFAGDKITAEPGDVIDGLVSFQGVSGTSVELKVASTTTQYPTVVVLP
jgi:FlaG/FlaF family flagellin (archaellin)